MRLAALLVAAVALAGCADPGQLSEGPVPQGEPVYSDHPGRPTTPPPEMTWGRLAEGSFRLDLVASAVRVPVSVPNGTIKVMVNLTFEAGYTMDPRVVFDACAVRIDGGFAAIGQTFPVDCGRIHDVTAELYIDHASGELSGRFTVENLVCARGGVGCP